MTPLDRTKDNPWVLQTPPGTSEYTMHVEERDGAPVLVCTVGKTVLLYDARCIEDLHTMLVAHGDWMPLGSTRMSRNRPRPARWRRGAGRRITPWAAGMG